MFLLLMSAVTINIWHVFIGNTVAFQGEVEQDSENLETNLKLKIIPVSYVVYFFHFLHNSYQNEKYRIRNHFGFPIHIEC